MGGNKSINGGQEKKGLWKYRVRANITSENPRQIGSEKRKSKKALGGG